MFGSEPDNAHAFSQHATLIGRRRVSLAAGQPSMIAKQTCIDGTAA